MTILVLINAIFIKEPYEIQQHVHVDKIKYENGDSA